MAPDDFSTLDDDVAEVRRRVDALVVDLKSLGLDAEVSIEEYGLSRDPAGIMTRTVNFSVTVWQRDD